MNIIERVLELENGNKVKFTAGPRYPYWRISFERGGIPDCLSGWYTDYDKAVLAVKQYLEQRRNRNKTTIKTESKEV